MKTTKYNIKKQTSKTIDNSGQAKVTKTLSEKNISLPFYILFGFAFLLYANSLINQYTLDDRLMITENAFTKKGISGIGDILTTDSFVGFFGHQKNLVAGGRYRPLSHITFAIEYAILGFNPFVGHLINILLYAFSCLLVYKVLTMIFPPGKKPFYMTLPFIATALFIAHPLHTEVVANVKGRDDIMGLLANFGTLYFILKYADKARITDLLWASIVFLLGLFSKENVITFVAIIPLTLYFFTKTPAKRIYISTLILFVITIVFICIRTAVLGSLFSSNIDYELLNNPFIECTVLQKFATIFYTWGRYLILLVFPHPLTHDYYPKQIPIIGMADIRALLSLMVYVFLIVIAFMQIKKKTIISYCILFFGLSFSISSNLVFPIGTFMNERFVFIPLLGFCIIIANYFPIYLKKWFGENSYQKAMYITFGIILFAYSAKTIARNPVWHDDYTLFSTDVNVSTNSAKCNISAGGQTLELAEKVTDVEKKNKMINDALVYLNKGIKIHPRYVAGWILLGKAMIDIEDYKKAREYYDVVLQISPGQKDALNNMLYCAQICNKNKNYDESILSYKKLMTFQPSNKDLYMGLAGVYENKLQIDSVLNIMNRLLVADPAYAPALGKLGEMYGKYLNNLDKSIEYMMKAFTITPNDASLLENLGVAYGIKKDFKKSIEYFNKSLELKPDNPQTYINLSGSYFNLGNKQKAAECQAKANELMRERK